MKATGFIDSTKLYTSPHDIVWSFDYNLVGVGDDYAIGTYLVPAVSIPIYTLHELENLSITSIDGDVFLLDDNTSEMLTDESGNLLIQEEETNTPLISIIFDSTGYNALSSVDKDGVGVNSIKSDSLIVRGPSNNLLYNESLSAIHDDFIIPTPEDVFKSLRFKYSNVGKLLTISQGYGSEYVTMIELVLDTNEVPLGHCYPAFAYTSPVSSTDTGDQGMSISKLQSVGDVNAYTTHVNDFVPLSSDIDALFTTISGISADILV
jgi:hypothetical protein